MSEFRSPLLLEAGAGTGKTATLVARIVHWCAGPGWEEARKAKPEEAPENLAAAVLRGGREIGWFLLIELVKA